ncbi:CD63 antigen isoform X2 [Condylostylus longicornis]|nr:CD63 antigen isoform X2 [Condylostylus longicornis]
MGEGGVTCVKYIMFFCNLLFALTGLLMLTIGAIVQINYIHYSNLIGDTIWTAPIVLIIVGIVVFIIGFLGCCGACKENSCMILTFAFLIIVIFLAEIGIAIAGYIKHDELRGILENQFNYTLVHYNERKDYQDTWKVAQSELSCCGINGPNDWENIYPRRNELPASCCTMINLEKSTVCDIEHAHKEGCLNKLWILLDSKTVALGAAVLAIVLIQLLTLFYAFCLFRSFRRR